MSKPRTIYRINWQSFHESTDLQCYIDISDMDNLIDDSETSGIVPLTGSGNPANLSVINNDEDPFTVVLAQQLTIQFLSEGVNNSASFMTGSDSRWFVHYYLGDDTKTLFKGYLNTGPQNVREAFLATPNVVTLTANDGLGSLKDIKLINADDENPSGYHRISDYLTWALRQTGLELEMRAAFNIKRSDLTSDISIPNTDAEHFFYTTFLEAKTFEDEIGTSEDCYTVIEKILGEEARLFQMFGQWWIVRIDEVEDLTRGLYISSFDSSGSFVANLGEFDFKKEIGGDKDIFFAEAASEVTADRPHKSVRLDFEYEAAREVPCNVDFSRGDNEVTISPTEKHYDLDCWTLYENRPISTPSVNATAYLVKNFTDDYEVSRYAEISTASSAVEQILVSEAFPIGEGDKFAFQVDVSYDGQIETGSSNYNYEVAQIWLFADDGTYYTLHGGDSDTGTVPVWVECTSAFNTNQKFFHVLFNGDDDDTEWRTVTFMYGPPPPCPKDGAIKIALCHKNKVTGFKIRFQNLQYDYVPLINGSYRKYTGQYHEVAQDGGYKAKREKRVYIGDSPKKLFKGGLFKYAEPNYELITEGFYNAAVAPSGPTAELIHPYGEIQVFDVWNQFKPEMRIIEGTMQGIDLDKTKFSLPYPAHLVSKWKPTDNARVLSNRFFILLHFNQDHNNGGWTGVFRETVNVTRDKNYTNRVFKYIS